MLLDTHIKMDYCLVAITHMNFGLILIKPYNNLTHRMILNHSCLKPENINAKLIQSSTPSRHMYSTYIYTTLHSIV